jgi:hypothetical protein
MGYYDPETGDCRYYICDCKCDEEEDCHIAGDGTSQRKHKDYYDGELNVTRCIPCMTLACGDDSGGEEWQPARDFIMDSIAETLFAGVECTGHCHSPKTCTKRTIGFQGSTYGEGNWNELSNFLKPIGIPSVKLYCLRLSIESIDAEMSCTCQ